MSGSGGYPPPGHPYPPPGYPYPPPYFAPPSGWPFPQFNKHLGWFIVNWLFFWPTAIYSTVAHFQKIDWALAIGDLASAREHAAAVRKHGIIALVLNLGLSAIFATVCIIILVHLIRDGAFNSR